VTIQIAYMSDLHIDFERIKLFDLHAARQGGYPAIGGSKDIRVGPNLKRLRQKARAGQLDLVLIAGDISAGWEMTARYIELVADYLSVPVVFVAGNHEFYDRTPLDVAHASLREQIAPHPHAHFLEAADPENPGSVLLDFRGRKIRILGSTLWADFAVFGEELRERTRMAAQYGMTDFEYSYFSVNENLTAKHTEELHRQALERFTAIQEADRTALREQGIAMPEYVVLSHMAPAYESVKARYERERDHRLGYYASNLEGTIATLAPRLWVHGHIHRPHQDYRVGETRILSAPRGYYGHEYGAERFEPQIVELPAIDANAGRDCGRAPGPFGLPAKPAGAKAERAGGECPAIED